MQLFQDFYNLFKSLFFDFSLCFGAPGLVFHAPGPQKNPKKRKNPPGGPRGPNGYDLGYREILGYQDFPKNDQKTLFCYFSSAAKKRLKNAQKTLRRPRRC